MSKGKSSLLIDETPLMVLPSLAAAIGLNEAIFVQQLHWLTLQFGKTVKGQEGRWVYNTFEEWHEKYPFWSVPTIKRIVTGLRKEGIVKAGRFNKMAIDQTRWYSLDYEVLNSKSPIVSNWDYREYQNDTMTEYQSDTMLPKRKNTNQRNDYTPPAQTKPQPTTTPLTESVAVAGEQSTRPRDLLFDAIAEHWQAAPGQVAILKSVMLGTNRKYPACNFSPPATPDEVGAFVHWYARKYPNINLPVAPEKLQTHFYAFRKSPATTIEPETRWNGEVKEQKVGGVWYRVHASQGLSQ